MESSQAFLRKDETYEDSDSEIHDAEQLRSTVRGARRWRLSPPAFVLHGILILLYTTGYFLLSRKIMNQGCAQRDLIYCEFSAPHQRIIR
jgi:hypothetical protein